MAKKTRPLSPDEPLRHPDHPRPVTRRDFLRQGFISGSAMVTGMSLLDLLYAKNAFGALSSDISNIASAAGCPVGFGGNKKIPFICFDLAGGANLAGSNVLVGGQGGQDDHLDTSGYSKLGITGDRVPSLVDSTGAGNGDFTDSSLGLKFHSESALLAGIMSVVTAGTAANTNGFVIPARSDNDTSNNPHNPMYGIARAGINPGNPADNLGYGAKGDLLTLIGSVASDSGGNSIAPIGLMDPSIRPTKVSRPSDVTGLVDTGNLTSVLTNPADVVSVMETVTRISNTQIGNATLAFNSDIQNLMNCGYAGATDSVNRFPDSSALDPTADANINTIFNKVGGVNADSEFLKAASVMKLVVNGNAGAGTIQMGGFDYHTGDRTTGELRDLRAGICIGACLEYAALVGRPLMIYVFSDGSLFSNGMTDNNSVTRFGITVPGGKGVWTGDNSSTACSFALVYNPAGRPTLKNATNQIGYFRKSGDVETAARTAGGNPIMAANNVTSLVYTVLLNYMALHNENGGQFASVFPQANLGNNTALDELTAFNPIVDQTIDVPI